MAIEIPKEKQLEQQVFAIENEEQFREIALAVFNFQFVHNALYQSFCRLIRRTPAEVRLLEEIPFLPISFFKSHEIKTTHFDPQIVFTSSGTTGAQTSRHFVREVMLYEKSFLTCFESFFGPVADFCILGLLPSYLERKDSSLVYMVNTLISKCGHPSGGFYLYDHQQLFETIKELEAQQQKTILFGVSFALLDFAAQYSLSLQHTSIIETGGMKGRKEEMSKEELYRRLQLAFGLAEIHSEYGMTELLSQAYAVNGQYATPPWMKLLLRDETDPFSPGTQSGAINVIDLANLYSCSFIATDDRGRRGPGGRLEVLGRLDNSDVRGCSQLV